MTPELIFKWTERGAYAGVEAYAFVAGGAIALDLKMTFKT